MSTKTKNIFFLIALIAVIASGYFIYNLEIFTSSAQSDDNLTGYAWSENMGWISFNCTNEDNCSDSNYGVHVDMETGDFSGYAWSSGVGWLDLSPDGPFPGSPYHGAKYEYGDSGDERRVTGWSKALVLGDEGWIKLHSDPWLEGWGQRRKITIDADDIDGDLSQFPVPLFINTSAGQNNADISSIFDEVGSDSQKIAIAGPDATTQLYAEIEKWDASAEEAVVWVGGYDIDIDSSSDTYLYLYYDGEQADNDEYVTAGTNATTSEQIWGNDYAMVQHLNEESGDALDSSPNGNDGTVYGATQGATGQVDGAYDFDGSDDYVDYGDKSAFEFGEGESFSASFWMKPTASANNSSPLNKHYGTEGEDRPWYLFRYRGDPETINWMVRNSSGEDTQIDAEVQVNEWQYVIGIYDGVNDELRLFIDGQLKSSASGVAQGAYGTNDSILESGSHNGYFPGGIDDVRIYSSALSSDEITAHYEAGRDNLLTWSREESDNYGVTADIHTGDFSGWAWNKSRASNAAGIGWLSFNCADDGAGGCTDTNYKVTGHLNTVASTSDLTAPNWSHADACSDNALRSILRWQFNDPDKGAEQGAYNVVVDTDGTRDDDEPLVDTGKVEGSSKQYLLSASDLDYDTSYYWWIKVWDNHDVASDWNQYDTDPDTDNDDGDVYTFTTYKHEFPEVYFHWVPDPVSLNEDVTFTDDSLIYTNSNPTTATSCSSSTCDYAWEFSGGDVTIKEGGTSSSSVTVEFNSTSTYSVALDVTDQEDYQCSSSTSIEINPELPSWREVKVEE